MLVAIFTTRRNFTFSTNHHSTLKSCSLTTEFNEQSWFFEGGKACQFLLHQDFRLIVVSCDQKRDELAIWNINNFLVVAHHNPFFRRIRGVSYFYPSVLDLVDNFWNLVFRCCLQVSPISPLTATQMCVVVVVVVQTQHTISYNNNNNIERHLVFYTRQTDTVGGSGSSDDVLNTVSVEHY